MVRDLIIYFTLLLRIYELMFDYFVIDVTLLLFFFINDILSIFPLNYK